MILFGLGFALGCFFGAALLAFFVAVADAKLAKHASRLPNGDLVETRRPLAGV